MGLGAIITGHVERLLGLADGEGSKAVRLLSLVFTMSSALVLLKAVQSGIFLVAYPRSVIPWAFAASAVTLASLSMLSVPMAARLGPVKLASFTLGLSATALIALRVLLWMGPPHIPFVLYVLVEAICGLLLIQIWSVVSEATNARSAKRLLPVAGVGASIAWTVVGLLVPGIVHLVGAAGLLVIAPLLLLAALGLVQAVARLDLGREATRGRPRAPMIQEWKNGLAFVRSVPLMRVMTVLSVLALISEQLMDYQMMAAARERYVAPAALASFFGNYYGVTSALSLLLLLGASGRALATLGASRSLLVVPLVTIGGAALSLATHGFWSVVFMRASDRVLKQSLWSSASEQTQTPLPVLRRAQARALIRGVIAPAGYAVAALVLAALPPHFELRWLALATMVLCAIMAALILIEVRRSYQRALHQAVDDRKLDLNEGAAPLDQDACLALMVELRSEDTARASLAAELLRNSSTPLADEALVDALTHPAPSVRVLVIDALTRRKATVAAAPIARLLAGETDTGVRLGAARALRVLGPAEGRTELLSLVDHRDGRVRAAARVALVAADDPRGYEGGTALLPLLRADDPALLTEALSALVPACQGEPAVVGRLRDLLISREPLPVRKAVLDAVARLRVPLLLPYVMKLLEDHDLAAQATASLSEWGEDTLAPLSASMGHSVDSGRMMLGSVTMAPGASAGQTVFVRLLSHADSAVRERAARALALVVRGGKRPPLAQSVVLPLLDHEIASAYRLHCVLGGLAHDDGTPDWEIEPAFQFLAGEIERRVLSIRGRVLHLLALMGNSRMVRGVEFGLRRTSAAVDAKVAELLELMLDPELARKVVPLFDRLSLRERAEVAQRLGVYAADAVEDPLAAIVALGDPHLLGCAMLTYGERFAGRFPQVYERDLALLPLFERMTFLRSVPLFSELSGEDLRSIAEIVETIDYPAGTTIFRKGDPGEDLFLIVKGQVAVRDAKIELAVLGEREFFGELAVLDREPRSADTICTADARLLRLRGVDLGELMARRPQICEQVMLILVRRLRALTHRVAK
jgi:HEAT repeat protein